jgi:hypothetical protein
MNTPTSVQTKPCPASPEPTRNISTHETLQQENLKDAPLPKASPVMADPTRQSTRKRAPRDILHLTHHGKAYHAGDETRCPKKQRVPVTLEYEEKQRVTLPALKTMRRKFASDTTIPFATTANYCKI